MLTLTLAFALAGTAPLDVLVVVPLCDGSALACGSAPGLGDPRDLERNLYWGARYGAERFLARASGFRVLARRDVPDAAKPALLRETIVELEAAGARAVRLRLQAWDGGRIDDALAAFFDATRTHAADVVVWAGHDRLMDVPPPRLERAANAAPVAVLACDSERYFVPVLTALGAEPLALTRTFMAPEAYLLEALARSVATHGMDRERLRIALVAAYARHQRISTKAAGTVFPRLP